MATISTPRADHVTPLVRSVDPFFLQYAPRLLAPRQVVRFPLNRGYPIPSPAVPGKIDRGYAEGIKTFIAERETPAVRFVKEDIKEQIARSCRR